MPRPKSGYRTADGERVPGVTTICKIIQDKDGLIHWAWQCGIDGKDYREVRDDAASAGTLAHVMVEAYLTRKQFVLPDVWSAEISQKAHRAFDNFKAWEAQNKLEIIATEMTLVSERYRYGGTMDGLAVANVSGKRSLVDWKTSRSIYENYLAQLAAYAKLWEEHHPDQPIDGGFHLLRISRDYGDFSHHYFDELEEEWYAFLDARSLYDRKKRMKRRVA